jgi:protein involved in polysaccharide export with SLBB domain
VLLAGGTAPARSPAFAAGDAPVVPYRLEAGDTVEVRFFFSPELNETVQIRPDGRISMQLAGEIALEGKTVAEAVDAIQQAYARELKTPRVSVQLRGYAGQKVFVTGEVNRPGVVAMPGRMTVAAALADAGGVRLTANPKQIVLVHKGPDGNPAMQRLTLMAKGKLGPDAYTELRAYDILMVPESRIAHMDRWVEQHIKSLNPVNLSAGFTYLYNKTGTGALPF